MKCPRTHTDLKKINVGKVPVYVSQSCGGVFFENQTLKLFDSFSEKRGKALVEHLSQFHSEAIDLSVRIKCPTCPEIVMSRRFNSPLHAVEIDECPNCGGIWLDMGELSKLQSLMLNEKERATLRQKLMEENRHPEIKSLPHKYDNWHRRSSKVDALLDIASYLTRLW